jgi:hypothetical protein
LLASYNEDTKTTARKKIGAFYTPREVVRYMVDEALIAHLPARLEPQVRALLSDQAGNPLDESGTQHLIEAIETIRVLDPACGSGAFPMGALHRLVHMLAKLDPKNRKWKEQQRKRALRDLARADEMEDPENRQTVKKNVEARLKDIEHSFDEDHHDLDFGRKLYLIENSIYGVDIEPIACQIAKLRFFVALLVDQKVSPRAHNFGVRPLPNLETRIVAADSLTPIEKVKDHQMFIGADQVLTLRERLRLVRHEHFNARTPEDKQRFREEDAAIREELSVELHRQGMPNQTARLLAGWDPYNQNTHAEFFDPEWMFSLDAKDFSGFDVVIGNPPYVRQEQIKELKPRLKQHYECYTGTADLYVYFYERGVQLLKPGGVFSFISSNKWFRSAYGEKLRAWLKKSTCVRRLIDFGDAGIFDAIAYPCIVILSKGAPSETCGFQALNWDSDWNVAEVRVHLSGDTFTMDQRDLAPEAWRLDGGTKLKLLGRIRAAGVPLGEYVNGRFYYGIKTGLNEAFVVGREKRDELIAAHPSSARVLKPFLRGRDVKRWRIEFEERYLLFVPWHFPLHEDPSVSGPSAKAERRFEKEYPAVYAHLRSFKSDLAARNSAETGVRYEWYALQRWGAEYWQEFERPKIIYPDIYEHQSFAWDEHGYYGANTCYFIPTREKWLLAVLNSKAVEWFYSQISNKIRGGYLRAFSDYMRTVPIPRAAVFQQKLIERLSEYLIYFHSGAGVEGHSAMAAYFERLLNGLVYELFFESDLHAQRLTFFAHLDATRPPKLAGIPKSQRTARLAEFHAQIADINHPLYACLFALNGLEAIRIIEGKA